MHLPFEFEFLSAEIQYIFLFVQDIQVHLISVYWAGYSSGLVTIIGIFLDFATDVGFETWSTFEEFEVLIVSFIWV